MKRLLSHLIFLTMTMAVFQVSARPSQLTYDVVVVGAGPVGLATAIEARRAGARVLVTEKRLPTAAPGSDKPWASRNRVVILNPDVSQFLRDLKASVPYQPFSSLSLLQGPQAHVYPNVEEADEIYRFVLGRHPHSNVRVGELESALLAAALREGIEVRFGVNTSVVSHDGGAKPGVVLKITEGPNDFSNVHSQIAFLAAGAGNSIAESIGFTRVLRAGSSTTEMITAEFKSNDTHQIPAKFWLDAVDFGVMHGGALSALGWTSVSVVAPKWVHSLSRAEFNATATQILKTAAAIMGVPGDLVSEPTIFSLATDDVEGPPQDSVFLLGDAARRTNPATAMGVNLGLNDATHVRTLVATLINAPDSFSAARRSFLDVVRRNSDTSGERSLGVSQKFHPYSEFEEPPSCRSRLVTHP